jgi:predicted translin family RNA/ssDNA-binding protein
MTRPSRSSAEPPGRRGHPSTPSEGALAEAERTLAQHVRDRDQIFEEARALRRGAQDAMRRMHAGEDPVGALKVLAVRAREIQRRGGTASGLADDALQEYAEARLLEAVVHRRGLPTARALGVPLEPYLLALGDLVGEVRRLAVVAMGREELEEAEELLGLMEELLLALLRFEAPRSLISLKPKQDAARGMVEKTRSELALAQVLRRAARVVGRARGGSLVSEGLKAAHRLGGERGAG